MKHTTIERLALRASKGNTDAFGRIYDYFIVEIYRFVYYKTHHTQTAEDLSADIFVKALRNISSYDGSKASFRTWLYTIARRVIIDHYRGDKHNAPIEDAWDIPGDTHVEQHIHAQIDLDRIRPYLAKLKADQREIILLRLWEDMSFKEIAEVQGKSEASCKMAFSRSIKVLRASMPLSLFLFFILNI
jgi:RNA polymerase sigma-70 factor (ECF subfamily)